MSLSRHWTIRIWNIAFTHTQFEFNVTSFFFQCDSKMECRVYTLNSNITFTRSFFCCGAGAFSCGRCMHKAAARAAAGWEAAPPRGRGKRRAEKATRRSRHSLTQIQNRCCAVTLQCDGCVSESLYVLKLKKNKLKNVSSWF